MSDITALEIECATACNWRCAFCPVAVAPKTAEVMPMELFEAILAKAVAHPTMKTVSINSYNEPSIDPLIVERFAAIGKTRLDVLLHTNGSGFTFEKLAAIKASGALGHITFNVPTLDPARFKALTGSSKLENTIRAIDYAHTLGISNDIVVNGTDEEIALELPAIKARFPYAVRLPNYALDKPRSITNDRLGILPPKYTVTQPVMDPHLFGCMVPEAWLYVSIKGDFFLCCQDYHQRSVYANIADGSIDDILASKARAEIMANVRGEVVAPDDFICRKCSLMTIFKERAERGVACGAESKPA